MYYLKNLYSTLVKLDSFNKFITRPVVIPFMRRVNNELAVTCIKNRFLVLIEYSVFSKTIMAKDIPIAPLSPP